MGRSDLNFEKNLSASVKRMDWRQGDQLGCGCGHLDEGGERGTHLFLIY